MIWGVFDAEDVALAGIKAHSPLVCPFFLVLLGLSVGCDGRFGHLFVCRVGSHLQIFYCVMLLFREGHLCDIKIVGGLILFLVGLQSQRKSFLRCLQLLQSFSWNFMFWGYIHAFCIQIWRFRLVGHFVGHFGFSFFMHKYGHIIYQTKRLDETKTLTKVLLRLE